MKRLTLSGRNNLRDPRTVYLDDEPIGEVFPVSVPTWGDAWQARDLNDHSHGDSWLTDWYAAEALRRGLNL